MIRAGLVTNDIWGSSPDWSQTGAPLIIYDPLQLRNGKHKCSITFFSPASQTHHGFPLFKRRNEAKFVFWPERERQTDIPSSVPRRPGKTRTEMEIKPNFDTWLGLLVLISIFVHFSSLRGSQRNLCKRVDVVYRSAIIIPSTNQRAHYRHIVLRSSSEKDWKED